MSPALLVEGGGVLGLRCRGTDADSAVVSISIRIMDPTHNGALH
jgi:hypothetical protein